MNISFRLRIIISLLLILSIALLFPYFAFKAQLEKQTAENFQNQSARLLKQADWFYTQESDLSTYKELETWLTNFSQILEVDLAYISDQGKIIKPLKLNFGSQFEPEKYLAKVMGYFSNKDNEAPFRERY